MLLFATSTVRRYAGPACLALLLCFPVFSQTVFTEINNEHNPAKRVELSLTAAANSFDSARSEYSKGEIEKGDAQLEMMTSALNICLHALDEARKARLYKKAELNVANLQRRMRTLLDDIEAPRRGWAEYTDRKLEEIHDKLLTGALGK